VNTRIMTADYDYAAPETLAEAFAILGGKEDVKVLAGGTDLLIKLKIGANIPISVMMDIKRIAELNGIKELPSGGIEIGATTKLSYIEKQNVIAERYPALLDALKAMAAIAVRNMGTIGGNIANASPAADTACPCMIYGGKVKLVSAKGERLVALKDFFTGPGKSVMQKEELLFSIILDPPPKNSSSAFIKKTRVKADISKISTAALITRDGDQIANCSMAMGSIAATPLCVCDIAAELTGKTASIEMFNAIGKKIGATINPINDSRSTAKYRKSIAEVIVTDVLTLAWQRAGGTI
jgi:CO/xanthine dehydrogenase FAD-binding subunit